MKAAEKSRFGKLVAYLLDPQGKKTRVGEVSITNCVSSDTTWAVREITATQRLNARAISDRTYHLLVSLRAGENPDAQTLRVIEERFCKELGYAEHQRVRPHFAHSAFLAAKRVRDRSEGRAVRAHLWVASEICSQQNPSI